jgi:hypothetical protein
LFVGTFDALKIIKKKEGIELRKLSPPKIEGVKNFKKQNIKPYKGRFLTTQNIPCMLLRCY